MDTCEDVHIYFMRDEYGYVLEIEYYPENVRVRMSLDDVYGLVDMISTKCPEIRARWNPTK
jgi:hypothetical protein